MRLKNHLPLVYLTYGLLPVCIPINSLGAPGGGRNGEGGKQQRGIRKND